MALALRLNRQQSWSASLWSWQYFRRNLATEKCAASEHGLTKQNPIPLPVLCMKTSKPDILISSNQRCELSLLIQKLSLREHSMTLSRESLQSHPHYILPTSSSNTFWKKTIIEPLITPKSCNLPTRFSQIMEKVTPSLGFVFPIRDPNPLQPVVDQGAPPVSKEAMPWLMQIRKKKMKKHKLKKLHKRMRFVYRKQRDIKQKKKEKAIQMEVKQILKEAEDFDPEKYVEDELKKARQGGWSIDILEEYHQAKKSKSAVPSSVQSAESQSVQKKGH